MTISSNVGRFRHFSDNFPYIDKSVCTFLHNSFTGSHDLLTAFHHSDD